MFQLLKQIIYFDRFTTAKVKSLKSLPIGSWPMINRAENSLHDIADVSKVAAKFSLGINLDRPVREDRLREFENRHVRPTPRAINRKQTQRRYFHSVLIGVAIGHKFAGHFGRRIQTDRLLNVS